MTAREWFNRAKEETFAIGAFNVDSFDIFKAICLAGQRKKSPVMLEFSQGEIDYLGIDNIVALTQNARKQYGIPILLNLDHSKKVEDCEKAVEEDFDDVHFDGSESPFEQNVVNIKKVVEAAHKKDILVEGEINALKGASEVHKQQLDSDEIKKSYTIPEEAKRFVDLTRIDIFAAVFGNVHGTFPTQPDLDFGLLKKISGMLPDTFLSMHGGSGIPANQVKEAIKIGGIVKVNVNTELRVAFIDSLNEKVNEQPQQFTYYKMTDDIINSVAAVVEGKIDVFGSAGKAQ